MTTLTEDIQTFFSLHHRTAALTPEERALYEALRTRVQRALQQPSGPADIELPSVARPS